MFMQIDDTIVLKHAGDTFHLFATITLTLMIWKSKKSTGFSGKSQLLYAIVYLTRYLGSFIDEVLSTFEIISRISLTLSSFLTVYLIYFKFNYESSRKEDSFRIKYLLVPAAILALFYNPAFSDGTFAYEEIFLGEFYFLDACWAFSYYLEAVAILPQLLLLYNQKDNLNEKQDFVTIYLMIMSFSRILYTIHSICEKNHDVITDTTGVIQFCTYLMYFLWQFKSSKKSQYETVPNVEA